MITQKTRKADKSYKPELLQIPAREQSSYSLQDFEAETAREWIELSGVSPDLYRLNVDCQPDEVTTIFGEFSRPLHDALNWGLDRRWALVEDRNYGAIIRSYDGSVFQVKLQRPRTRPDGEKVKTVKYETPLGSSTSLFLAKIDLATWKNICSDGSYQDLPANATTDEISSAFWEWVKQSKQTIVWCEGAKKALCLISSGSVAIALSGISNGYRSPKDDLGNRIGKSFLVPEVAEFVLGQNQMICFDSDLNPKTVKAVNANIRNLGRLINQKSKTGKKDVDVVKVVGWDSSLGKGVDDLIVGNGIDFFRNILKVSKPFIEWKIGLEGGLTLPISLEINREKVGDLSLDIPIDTRMPLLKSGLGTGKTHSIADLIKDRIGDPSQVVFVITHRDNLATELSNRFGIVHRREVAKSFEGSAFGYVLCADSLHGKADPSFNPADYKGKKITVIIDECESVAWHVLSSMTAIKDNRVEILENLSNLLAMALSDGQVILADAHLTDRSYSFFKDLACQAKPELIDLEPFLIVNTAKIAPFVISIYDGKVPSRWKVCLDAELKTKPNTRLIIQVESQKIHSKWSTQTLEADLKKSYPHKKIVRVDSQTVQDPNHAAYLATKNFKDFCKNWEIVICSNLIESGIDISLYGHFESVWACIWGVSSPKQAVQTLHRVRENIPRHIWIAPRAMNRVGNGSDIDFALLKSIDRQTKFTLKALQQNGLGDLETGDECLSMALKAWAGYGAEINHQGRHLQRSILSLLTDHPDVNPPEDIDSKAAYAAEQGMAAVRDVNYEAYAKSVEEQRLLTQKQAEDLEQKAQDKGKTDTEQKELRKYNLHRNYNESDSTTVKKDDKNWYSQINLHYLMTVGKPFLLSKDAKAITDIISNGKAYALDVLKPSHLRKVKVLELTKILDLIPAAGEVTELWNGCDRLKDVVAAIKLQRNSLKQIFNITLKPQWFGEELNIGKSPSKESEDYTHETSRNYDGIDDDLNTQDINIIKPILKLLGARLLPIGKKGSRGKQERKYRLVYDYKSVKGDREWVYFDIVEWREDNRYKVFDHWLERDTDWLDVPAPIWGDSKNVSDDTVVTFLFKDIKKSDYQSNDKVTTDKVTTDKFEVGSVGLVEQVGSVASIERIDPQPIEQPKPVPMPPMPPVRIVEGLKIVYQGFKCTVKRLGTATARIVSESGWDYGYIDLSELQVA